MDNNSIRQKAMNKKQETINKIKFFNSSEGYTIVELLAVMIVLSAVGAVIIGVISSTLRGANKTNSLNQIRQEGNNRMSGISKMIEFARSFDGISEYESEDRYYPNCLPGTEDKPKPEKYYYLKVTNFTNIHLVFSCSDDPNDTEEGGQIFASNSASLIDSSTLRVTNCYFTCTQNFLAQPPIIGIYFTLSEKNTVNVENNSSVSFETNISMRNLGR
jgi:type II secretory pathway pseudopilin PulG